ncbi:MAG: hypothetical protein LLG20_23920 [Acidobacteriales bacterium]|nr:hypothetical protein [Terriglobales bacterium]
MNTQPSKVIEVSQDIQRTSERLAILKEALSAAFDPDESSIEALLAECRTLVRELAPMFMPLLRDIILAGLLNVMVHVEQVRNIDRDVTVIGEPVNMSDEEGIGIGARLIGEIAPLTSGRRSQVCPKVPVLN